MVPAQQMATLDSGERVVLHEDRTWDYATDVEIV